MTLPGRAETTRFAALLSQRFGWQLDEGQQLRLAETLGRRAAVRQLLPAAYLDLLAGPGEAEEWAELACQLTVTETYFNRYADQIAAFVQRVLPEHQGRSLRLLSMGCASGEEPYSLAIAVREAAPEAAAGLQIVAADLNPAMLARARSAQYSSWALRELPPGWLARWFRPQAEGHALCRSLVEAVEFRQLNLVADDPGFWQPARFDVVFCRNLLMYLGFEQARAAVARIAGALASGGYLFLGHAETLRGLSAEFQVLRHGDAYYYRKEGEAVPRADRADRAVPPIADGWAEAIRAASARIELLSGRALERAPAPAPLPAPDLGPVRDSLRRERFGQALLQLDQLQPRYGPDAELLLLRAVANCHQGDFKAARTSCDLLLAEDECHAGAHYLLALCCEGGGELRQAREHDLIACHLDPGFAMPRLHLGLLGRRLGEREQAVRDLQAAATLLRREESARLLLFGGGFQREALIAMCSAAGGR